MAKPRVFISSTFYDLKYVRESLEKFIENLGFEAVLSEKGSIAYDPSHPLDESCYRDVRNSDIFVLIIGGRYGSAASEEEKEKPKDFFDRYASITKREYESAVERDIPIYILVDRSVYTEYKTFTKNRDAENINYAHVDSVSVFLLIDQILGQPRNNPLYQFNNQNEITSWLLQQWSGLFKEMLAGRSEQQQLSSLARQVNELSEINTTFKRYLEKIVSSVASGDAKELIESEEKRLKESKRLRKFMQHPWIYQMVLYEKVISLEDLEKIFSEAKFIEDVAKALAKLEKGTITVDDYLNAWSKPYDFHDSKYKTLGEARINKIRKILQLPPLGYSTRPKTQKKFSRKRAKKKI